MVAKRAPRGWAGRIDRTWVMFVDMVVFTLWPRKQLFVVRRVPPTVSYFLLLVPRTLMQF